MEIKNNYNPRLYIETVESIDDQIMIEYMQTEYQFVLDILKSQLYDVYDLGAGYGRVLYKISDYCDQAVGIEIDADMYGCLVSKMKHHDNVINLNNDITLLKDYLVLRNNTPNLFLLCQNTFGVIEGDYNKMFSDLRSLSKNKDSEIVLSVFNSDALQTFGIHLYNKLKEMVGKIDLINSRFENGLIMTQSGYTSKWWTERELEKIFTTYNFTIIKKRVSEVYTIFHLKINSLA